MAEKIVDKYPLTAVQQGMLFHQLSAGGDGVDVEQIIVEFSRPIQAEDLLAAWRQLLAEVPELRVCLSWGEQTSSQCVCDQVDIPVCQHRWHDKSPNEYQRALLDYQARDRLRDFELSRAPLMRLALFWGPNNKSCCLWTFHHVLLDGRSFPVLLRRLLRIYEDSIAGNPIDTELLLPRFAGYTQWLQARNLESDNDFWRSALAGVHGAIPLQFGQPNYSQEEQRYQFTEHHLSKPLSAKLQLFAQQHAVTVHTLLQAAWALLIHHYTRETDIVFGSTRACRHRSVPGAEQMVGLLINTVPFRVQLHEGQGLAELLKQIRQLHVAIREHEHMPLPQIRKIAGITSELLFESLVVYDDLPLDARMNWPGLRFQYRGQTNFPLALIAYGGEQLLLRIEFDAGRFNAVLMGDFLLQLATLLENFIDSDSIPATHIDYLSEQQSKSLVAAGVRQQFNQQTSIHHLFENSAQQFPARIAVVYDDESLTYQLLNEQANRLAHHLIGKGVKPGELIGLSVDRSLQLVVGILAILKAGGAYVPLDPSYPNDRLSYVMDDAELRFVLTKSALVEELPNYQGEYIFIDQVDQNDLLSNPDVAVTPDHIAYVIYTSGSTGRPKGVKVMHKNIGRLFHATHHWFGFAEKDTWCLFHSTAFDFSVWEIWGALIYGGKLVVVPYWVSRSPENFYQLVKNQAVTVLNQTPSAFRQFIDCDLSAQDKLPALRYVIFGGEALDLSSLGPWVDRYGDQQPKLVNMYGITETTVHVTYRPITCSDITANRGSLIGEPIPDLSIYLLNDYLKPVPNGVVGEMYVAGDGLAAGYLKRDELTAERFICAPFNPEIRLYKTGDLARRINARDLEYLGRSDLQIKIRGFRIETGEIESQLQSHAAIKQAVVDIYTDRNQQSRLVAYYLPNGNGQLLPNELRTFLQQTLPDYMIPGIYVAIDKIPLTHNGKIDRKALPQPTLELVNEKHYLAPRSEREQLLCDIWQKVLDIEKIGINDDFFDLGGDSILTIKIISSLKKYGYDTTPQEIFKAKTIAHLAPQLQEHQIVTHSQEALTGELALLPAQQWFFEHNFAQRQYWNQTFLFRCADSLDNTVVQQALNAVVQHHDILRARFNERDGCWEQMLAEAVAGLDVEQVDLSARGWADAVSRMSTHCQQVQGSFDLSTGKLIACRYFSLPNSEYRLLIAIHHLVVDGVSWSILMRDLELSYRQITNGQQPTLPPKTSSLRDWHNALTRYAVSSQARQAYDYWHSICQKIGGADQHEVSAGPEGDTVSINVTFDPEFTENLLRRAHKAYNTRINDLLLSALALTLRKDEQNSSLVVDMEGHGRETIAANIDTSATIGWFTSIFPIHITGGGQSTVAATIMLVKEILRAVPHNGFDYLVGKYLANCEFNVKAPVLFNYLGQFDQTLEESSLFSFATESVGPWHAPENLRTHPLEFLGKIQGQQLSFEIFAASSAYTAADVAKLGQDFHQALHAIVEHCVSDVTTCYTPSDFGLVKLTQDQVNDLQQRYDIDAVYPLSPMQQLFYTADLLDRAHGFEQWHFQLWGKLDTERLQRAWQAVIDRHDILRTAFHTFASGQVVQVVCRRAKTDIDTVDFSSLSVSEQEAQIASIKIKDREKHFQLSAAPLSRVMIIRRRDSVYDMIWSTHHLCIDGWSWPLVFKDLAWFYRADKPSRESPAQFSELMYWLDKRSSAEDSQFWHHYLQGFNDPLLFAAGAQPQSLRAPQQPLFKTSQLPVDIKTQLERIAKNYSVTLNTLIQAAWASVLCRASGKTDVVFGFSSSGRPPQIDRVEEIVGPFVNNIPKRVRFSDDITLDQWLAAIQVDSLNCLPFEQTPILRIQEFCGLPLNQRLFETLLVFQNYATGDTTSHLGPDVKINAVELPQATNYPLTIVVRPSEHLEVTAYAQANYFQTGDIDNILGDFKSVLEQLVGGKDIRQYQPVRWQVSLKQIAGGLRAQEIATAGLSALGEKIHRVWARAFNLSQVDVDKSFFELGGQSIMLVSMHQELQQVLDQQFPITHFFKYPTINALTKCLAGQEDLVVVDDVKVQKNVALKKAAQRRRKAKLGK